MTAHELAALLLAGPDLLVTRRGYEGGVEEITDVLVPQLIHLNIHPQNYYGPHEYHAPFWPAGECYFCDDEHPLPTTSAIHLS